METLLEIFAENTCRKTILKWEKSVQLSQAAACDGQMYDITGGNVHNGNHGTFLPLFQDDSNEYIMLHVNII